MFPSIETIGTHMSNKDRAVTMLTTAVPEGKIAKVEIQDKKKVTTKPSFEMVGSGRVPRTGRNGKENRGYSMNYTKMLLGLSKPAGWLFEQLMDNRLWVVDEETGRHHPYQLQNDVYLAPSKYWTHTEKEYKSKGYKELFAKDMVIRYKRNRYLINPRLVVSSDNWEAEEVRYDSYKEELAAKSK